MNFGKILSRAWEITWRWKVLWVFGFLVGLGQGGSGGNNTFNWREDRWDGRFVERIPAEIIGLLVGLACVGLIIGIALWVLSIIGRGALIGGVQQVEEEGSTSLGQAWRVGVQRFWTLFGISILTGLPVFVMGLITVAIFLIPILTEIGLSAGREGPIGVFTLSFFCGAPFCCSTIIAAIVLSQIQIYANRAAVLEGLGWIDAFGRGWQVLKDNLGSTIVFWIIFFGIGLVLAMVLGGGLMALAVPFIAIFSQTDPGVWMLIPACGGGLLLIVFSALVGAVVETFTSTTWTLAYRDMTGTRPVEIESAPVE